MSSLGTWQLRVVDNSHGDIGTINNWSLELCQTNQTVGLDEYGLTKFSVYPNPSKGEVQLRFDALSAENDPRLEDTSFELGAYWQGERKTMPLLKKDNSLRKGSSYPKIILPEVEKFNSFHKKQMPQRYIQTQLDINQKRFFGGSRMAYNSPCKLCDYSQLCINGDATGLVKREEFKRKTA